MTDPWIYRFEMSGLQREVASLRAEIERLRARLDATPRQAAAIDLAPGFMMFVAGLLVIVIAASGEGRGVVAIASLPMILFGLLMMTDA